MPELAPEDYDRLIEIWEAAVRATHHFLPEGAVDYYRPLIRNEYLPSVSVTVARDKKGLIVGFIGLGATDSIQAESPACGCAAEASLPDGEVRKAEPSGTGKIEMLFVHPDAHGKGVGRSLVEFAKAKYAELLVDVNEQNSGAASFYRRCGFIQFGRSPLDSQGNPYPLLHMRLVNKQTG